MGTPAEEIEDLLQAFDRPAFFVTTNHHPVLNDIRRAVWYAHQRLDELRLLAVAEHSEDIEQRVWAVNQIGQRSGSYSIPMLLAIAHSLNTPERVHGAVLRAVTEIERRETTTEKSSNNRLQH